MDRPTTTDKAGVLQQWVDVLSLRDKASMGDLLVITMGGWKMFGHIHISWWLVVAPWLWSLAVTAVQLLLVGFLYVIGEVLS